MTAASVVGGALRAPPATSGASGGFQSAGLNNSGWMVNIAGDGPGMSSQLALGAGIAIALWLILKKKSAN